MASTDDPISISLTQSLTKQTASTRKHYASLKTRVLALAQGNADLKALIPAGQSQSNLTFQDVNVREVQVEALKEKFKDSVQRYAEVEREMREKKRNRMERQVRIVNPDLNQAEVKDVVRDAESGNGGGMFQQAVSSISDLIIAPALTCYISLFLPTSALAVEWSENCWRTRSSEGSTKSSSRTSPNRDYPYRTRTTIQRCKITTTILSSC